MKNTALILIDIQNDYFAGGKAELVNPLEALNNAKKLLNMFRTNALPIIHVQHINIRENATFFVPNTEGVKIHTELSPLSTENIVTKNFPNSFLKTNLLQILTDEAISSVVVCGMMTHMCIDTTVRAAQNHALDVTLIADACATKDLTFAGETIAAQTVQNSFMAALNGMFAKVVKTSDFIS